jgi:hypothetical protein
MHCISGSMKPPHCPKLIGTLGVSYVWRWFCTTLLFRVSGGVMYFMVREGWPMHLELLTMECGSMEGLKVSSGLYVIAAEGAGLICAISPGSKRWLTWS